MLLLAQAVAGSDARHEARHTPASGSIRPHDLGPGYLALQALEFAVCLDGANACPPKDCGGTGGYADLLEALANPAHEEHEQYRRWAGEDFNPEAFDLAATNAALHRLRLSARPEPCRKHATE